MLAAQHPNIIRFYGVCQSGVIANVPCEGLVSEYCKNEDVLTYMLKNPSAATTGFRFKVVRSWI